MWRGRGGEEEERELGVVAVKGGPLCRLTLNTHKAAKQQGGGDVLQCSAVAHTCACGCVLRMVCGGRGNRGEEAKGSGGSEAVGW